MSVVGRIIGGWLGIDAVLLVWLFVQERRFRATYRPVDEHRAQMDALRPTSPRSIP